ncbi:TIGR02678 family protein [Frankia sp. CNm7]|uniref:TIGR02678 family protein n=1 Tax=Frankia nepalensis TaxID=1836974 RepID=A0A937UPM9_9ACTN|nr:TIGR02678 family protein [Frankia nepalensis]MBL7497580.1 TIGR02678 family protein [Frankia nepalensis]MBL7509607.1 TIGR02678 family protein [Frankia nepalensis]MBL7517094.1 TIGR02678 family protein [Frankia nepalensis]MBL7631034.1 TIGR02678 family protein [Frankia nepalensis]
MRVAQNVSALDLDEYQQAARQVLRHPLITASYPDRTTLPLVRKWASQLRVDLAETLGYTLVSNGDTVRLRRVQDTLDATHPAYTRARKPFDRRRYAYLVLALSVLGRAGTQIALSELAGAVAAEAGRVDGLGMDTERKPDRDAFVDAVAWLETRGALRMADGSAVDWVNDPERAEALYDIDREITGAVYAPSRVLQHLNSVTDLLGDAASAGPAQGINAERRRTGRRARRLALEQPVVYYADVDEGLRGQLRAPALAEDLERLTGLPLERRAEGVALINTGGRLTDVTFPGAGTVAQAALLLCARIAGYLTFSLHRVEKLPAATAAERLADASARIDAALPARSGVTALLADAADAAATDSAVQPGDALPSGDVAAEATKAAGHEATYPFLSDSWLRAELTKLVEEFGGGMSERQIADPAGLLDDALNLLASVGFVARTDGGALILPLLARYRGVTAQLKETIK